VPDVYDTAHSPPRRRGEGRGGCYEILGGPIYVIIDKMPGINEGERTRTRFTVGIKGTKSERELLLHY
jgi:hypothetical protein